MMYETWVTKGPKGLLLKFYSERIRLFEVKGTSVEQGQGFDVEGDILEKEFADVWGTIWLLLSLDKSFANLQRANIFNF